MKTNNLTNFDYKFKQVVTSTAYRGLLLLLLLGLLYSHFEVFYTQIWGGKYANVWAFTHVSLSVFLLMKDNAFRKISSEGSITILTIALTYILHSNICQIDKYTMGGVNVFLMKFLIIMIVIGGLISIITSFTNEK